MLKKAALLIKEHVSITAYDDRELNYDLKSSKKIFFHDIFLFHDVTFKSRRDVFSKNYDVVMCNSIFFVDGQ